MDNSSGHQAKTKVLVLGASAESDIFYRLILDENLSILCFDRSPALYKDVLSNPNVDCRFIDFSKLEQVKEVIAKEQPDYSIAVPVGRALTSLGCLNDACKLNGPSFRAIDTMTDKYKLHLHLASIGYNDHDYICLPSSVASATEETDENAMPESLVELHSMADVIEERFGYPLIVKPRFGSGSLGVSVIRNRDDLLSYRVPERFKNDPILVEKYIYATEYLVNAFVDANGVCHSLGLYQKEMTPEPYRQELAYLSDDYSSDFKHLKACIETVAKSLDLTNCYIQADMFVNPENGKVNIVDLSPRLTGNSIIDMQLVNGINPIKVFKRCVVDKLPFEDFPVQKPACMHFFDFKDCPEGATYALDDATSADFLSTIYTQDELENVALIFNDMQKGQPLLPMTCGSDCYRGYIITTGSSLEQAKELAKRYVRALSTQP